MYHTFIRGKRGGSVSQYHGDGPRLRPATRQLRWTHLAIPNNNPATRPHKREKTVTRCSNPNTKHASRSTRMTRCLLVKTLGAPKGAIVFVLRCRSNFIMLQI